MAPNVRIIARRAGVSTATVSRVIHKSDSVRPETRRRVEEAMAGLGLDPADLVRGAKSGNKIIGVIIPDLSNIFFAKVIDGIEPAAQDLGYSLFICNSRNSDQQEIHFLRLLQKAQVSGIIITPNSDDDDSINNEYLNLLSNMRIPIVLVDRDVKYSNLDGVFIDNRRGAFEATRLLIENGHRRIATICGPMDTVPGRDRLGGYRDAFAAAGLRVDESLIFSGNFSVESGQEGTRSILRHHPDVTAIFPANNLMTLGCLSVLNQTGRRIPEDMAVVGFDNMESLEMLGVSLTVVDRSTQEMGRQAMKLLARLMEHRQKERSPARRIILTPKLIIRGSERRCRRGEEEREENEGNSKQEGA